MSAISYVLLPYHGSIDAFGYLDLSYAKINDISATVLTEKEPDVQVCHNGPLVGRICNIFQPYRALTDRSMKICTWGFFNC